MCTCMKCVLPGMVVQVMQVLLVFIHERGNIVELHLQVHHLRLEMYIIKNLSRQQVQIEEVVCLC